MQAGDLRDRITIRRATVTTDNYGGEVRSWDDLGQRWSMVRYGTGRERRDAAQLNANLSATFRVRRDSLTVTIAPADQIVLGDRTWVVAGQPVITPDRAFIDITALWAQVQPDVTAP